MRESLGKELDRGARVAARKDAGELVRLAGGVIKDLSKFPSSVAGSESTTAPATNTVRALTERPLVAGTLLLLNTSTGGAYVAGTDYTEDAPNGSFTNLTIPSGTGLTAHYHYYKGGGAGVSDHGALTGLADDDHTIYQTDARGDARYKKLSDERIAERSATDAASTYPLGVTIMEIAVATGWPAATGTVETLRYSDGRTVQFFSQKNGTLVRVRWWNEVSAAWSSFAAPNVADFAAASHVGSRDGHPLATTSLDGFTSAADKAKLDSLSAQALGAFKVYPAVAQNNIATSTYVKVDLGATRFDVSGWFAAGSSRYTPKKEGYYDFGGSVGIVPGVANTSLLCILFKNGIRETDLLQVHSAHTGSVRAAGSIPRIYANGTTDYFEMFVWHNFGVMTSDIQDAEAQTWFAGGYAGGP